MHVLGARSCTGGEGHQSGGCMSEEHDPARGWRVISQGGAEEGWLAP